MGKTSAGPTRSGSRRHGARVDHHIVIQIVVFMPNLSNYCKKTQGQFIVVTQGRVSADTAMFRILQSLLILIASTTNKELAEYLGPAVQNVY